MSAQVITKGERLEVRLTAVRPEIKIDPEPHTYEVLVNGKWLSGWPSVTEIVKATVGIPFSAGAWYGYKMGVNACCEISDPNLEGFDEWYATAKEFENPNSVLRKAGDRGTLIHEAIENWGQSGVAPNPQDFEPEDRDRVAGVAKWLMENEPEFIEQEVRTANLKYKYVGTFDAIVVFGAGDHKGKRALLDWKTSKNVYPDQHYPQLSAYVEAEREAGIEPFDFSAIIHIPLDGKVKLYENDEGFREFKALLCHYASIANRKKREKAGVAKRKAEREAKKAAK